MTIYRNQVSSRIRRVADLIRKRCPFQPKLAIVLGSGFQPFVDTLDVKVRIAYTNLPEFAPPRVKGHAGELLCAELLGLPILVLNGRTHFYEGVSIGRVTAPIRVLAAAGIESVLLTNAAGGINRKYRPGDFMSLTDHINFMGVNPLRSDNRRAPCFLDLTEVYDPALNQLLGRAARSAKAVLHSGVYLAVSGPTYETPAEIRAFARWGADAVGMSTVPEAIVARQCGLRVAALSCITNLAAGRSKNPISHEEVLATGKTAASTAATLLSHFVESYSKTRSSA